MYAGISYNYTKEYVEAKRAYDLVAEARVQSRKYTSESLCAVKKYISVLPTDYSAWVLHREVVDFLVSNGNYSLQEELEWIRPLARAHHKNYQIWHHFQILVEKMQHNILKDPEILSICEDEPKSIHFWGFFVRAVNLHLYKALAFTEQMIRRDVRNNSAFSARSTVLIRLLRQPRSPLDVLLERERGFLSEIAVLEKNPAFWAYVESLSTIYPRACIKGACLRALAQHIHSSRGINK